MVVAVVRDVFGWVILTGAVVAACGVIWRAVFRPIRDAIVKMLDFAERGLAALDKVEHELTANSGTSLKDAFVAMGVEVSAIKDQLAAMPVVIARVEALELRARDPDTRTRSTDPRPTPPEGVRILAVAVEPPKETDR